MRNKLYRKLLNLKILLNSIVSHLFQKIWKSLKIVRKSKHSNSKTSGKWYKETFGYKDNHRKN